MNWVTGVNRKAGSMHRVNSAEVPGVGNSAREPTAVRDVPSPPASHGHSAKAALCAEIGIAVMKGRMSLRNVPQQ